MPSRLSPFTEQQERWVIYRFGDETKPVAAQIRREFRKKFNVSPFNLPPILAFYRVKEHFDTTNSTKPVFKGGRKTTVRTNENIEKVSSILSASGDSSLRKVATEAGISYFSAHQIVRKDLKLFPYKPHLVQPLLPDHIAKRNEFCHWLRSQDPDFATKVIWSDEKLWQDRRVPNKQNERFWAASDPFLEVDCRTQSVNKRMCWAAIVDGSIFLYWFDANVRLNKDSYLDLLRFFWSKVQRKVRSKELWFQ